MVVCTDSESVLTFVEELTKLLEASFERQYIQILGDPEREEPILGRRHRGRPKRLFLRMSEKYPVEGSNVLLSALASVNSKSKSAYDIYCDTAGKENIYHGNDSTLKAEDDYSNMDEITILNPIWLFDSIANYSLATIA
jgi:hypothetical protein